jgi:hypothetical protein
MNYINELFFDDEPAFEEPEQDDNYLCPRCKTRFMMAEDLEYVGEHRVCPDCLTELVTQAAEETMDT